MQTKVRTCHQCKEALEKTENEYCNECRTLNATNCRVCKHRLIDHTRCYVCTILLGSSHLYPDIHQHNGKTYCVDCYKRLVRYAMQEKGTSVDNTATNRL